MLVHTYTVLFVAVLCGESHRHVGGSRLHRGPGAYFSPFSAARPSWMEPDASKCLNVVRPCRRGYIGNYKLFTTFCRAGLVRLRPKANFLAEHCLFVDHEEPCITHPTCEAYSFGFCVTTHFLISQIPNTPLAEHVSFGIFLKFLTSLGVIC